MNNGSDFHDSLGRIGPVAVVDVLGTLVIAVLYGYYMKVNVFLSIILFFIAGILVHFILDVDTPVSKFLEDLYHSVVNGFTNSFFSSLKQ